jgi:hypothetical protein
MSAERIAALEAALTEVTVAVDRMLNGRGRNGTAPSPRLQEAVDAARALVPSIPAQVGPRDEP